MTAKETERLAVLETKVDDIKLDITEIKELIEKQNTVMDKRSQQFVTYRVFGVVLTVVMAVLTATFLFLNYLKGY